jgi:hypothetical protein
MSEKICEAANTEENFPEELLKDALLTDFELDNFQIKSGAINAVSPLSANECDDMPWDFAIEAFSDGSLLDGHYQNLSQTPAGFVGDLDFTELDRSGLSFRDVLTTPAVVPSCVSTESFGDYSGVSDPKSDAKLHKQLVMQRHIELAAEIQKFPVKAAEAFNVGDIEAVKAMINDLAVENCVLKSPGSDEEKHGRGHIIEFFEELNEDHPDAVIIVKDVKWTDKYTLKYKFYFNGTYDTTKVYARPNAVSYSKELIVDHVDISKYSAEDLLKMSQREQELIEGHQAIKVLVKGSTEIHLNRAFKMKKYVVDYRITSFEPGNLDDFPQQKDTEECSTSDGATDCSNA